LKLRHVEVSQRPAEDYIRHASRGGAATGRSGFRGTDDDVSQAVAVEIARRRHRRTEQAARLAYPLHAVGGRAIERGEVYVLTPRSAADDKHRAGLHVAGRPDSQFVHSVTVQVAHDAERLSGQALRSAAVDLETKGREGVARPGR
jgi:hypothetical protein